VQTPDPLFNRFKTYNMSNNTEEDIDISELVKECFASQLILWNDDHNSFVHVIETLMRVLKHTHTQAEQNALIVHTKGKSMIKDGLHEDLKPFKDQLTDEGLSVTIETI